MNPTPDNSLLASKFKRLAAVDIRFASEKKCAETQKLYCELLGLAPDPPYKLGAGEQAMELRFVLQRGEDRKMNRTILYWEVSEEEIHAVHEQLSTRPGYQSVEAPPPLPDHLNKPNLLTLRSIIEDSSGNLFGLIANPAVPLMTETA